MDSSGPGESPKKLPATVKSLPFRARGKRSAMARTRVNEQDSGHIDTHLDIPDLIA